MAIPIPMKEYSLTVNDFNEPAVATGGQALLLLLTRLMLLEPGLFETHPDMGVGLITYFRYRENLDGLADELQSRIARQIDTYLPFLSGVQVNVEVQDNLFRTHIVINGDMYGIYYNSKTNSLETEYVSISDL